MSASGATHTQLEGTCSTAQAVPDREQRPDRGKVAVTGGARQRVAADERMRPPKLDGPQRVGRRVGERVACRGAGWGGGARSARARTSLASGPTLPKWQVASMPSVASKLVIPCVNQNCTAPRLSIAGSVHALPGARDVMR